MFTYIFNFDMVNNLNTTVFLLDITLILLIFILRIYFSKHIIYTIFKQPIFEKEYNIHFFQINTNIKDYIIHY